MDVVHIELGAELHGQELHIDNVPAFDPKRIYPRCMAGRRASPSEDCDGPWAYLSELDRHAIRRWEILERLAEAVEPFVVARGDGIFCPD